MVIAGVVDAGYNRSLITDHFSPSLTVRAGAPVWDAVWVWVGIVAWASALA
jgi:hypothetical protein